MACFWLIIVVWVVLVRIDRGCMYFVPVYISLCKSYVYASSAWKKHWLKETFIAGLIVAGVCLPKEIPQINQK